MADAVFWQILEDIQSGLQGDLSFTAQGSDYVQSIPDRNIVIRRMADDETADISRSTENTPGILLSPVRSVRPGEMGENARDDVMYHILLQLIDGNQHERVGNLRTYLKWAEQICKYLHNQDRPAASTSNGRVYIGHTETTDHLDERLYKKHDLMQVAIVVTYFSREPRGAT